VEGRVSWKEGCQRRKGVRYPFLLGKGVRYPFLLEAAAQPVKPKKSAYGLLAKYGPGPTEEEIDENRREMFCGFIEDLP
jgi:hypothetical protein